MLLDVGMTAAREFAFVFATRNQFVVFDHARGSGDRTSRDRSVTMHGRVRMDVGTAIDPGASPRAIVDDHDVIAPAEVRIAPSPGAEECTDRNAEPEADHRAHHQARTRSEVNDTRIVGWHD